MLEHLDNLAETAAKAISNIKFDEVVVWEGNANGAGSTAGLLQNMARTLPPMMQVMQDIGGIELPEYLGKIAADGATNGRTAVKDEVERALSSTGAPPSPDDRGGTAESPETTETIPVPKVVGPGD